jgi:exosortase H (IPTLxxWG-CTERM-specific)
VSAPKQNPAGPDPRRQQIVFLAVFAGLVILGFTLLSVAWVDEHVVTPFTAAVATVSGGLLDLLGQDITRQGTVLRSPEFAVNIANGCNGLETTLIFLAAVIAFPASWRARGLGLVLGLLAIQLVNLVRVAALFLTGAYFPQFFDTSHTVIWQTVVILSGVLLWLLWAATLARRPTQPAPT